MSFRTNNDPENPIIFAAVILLIIGVFVFIVFGACLYTQ